MIKYYILKGKTPIPETDLFKWAEWYETADRIVKQTELPGGVRVSTVFLGIDQDLLSRGDPILFETMIFGGEYDRYQKRFTTWEDAEEGHQSAIELVFK